jgi:hypothetical protein
MNLRLSVVAALRVLPMSYDDRRLGNPVVALDGGAMSTETPAVPAIGLSTGPICRAAIPIKAPARNH